MLLHVIQDMNVWLTHSSLVADVMQFLPLDFSIDPPVLAQFKQTDLVGDLQKAFDNFVKTGQAWAFLIGLVLGYMLKAFTTFG